MAKKWKGDRQEQCHRSVNYQMEGSSRQHHSHAPRDIHLPESSSASTRLVASHGQERRPFDPRLKLSKWLLLRTMTHTTVCADLVLTPRQGPATRPEMATINNACEGRKFESAGFICRLFEEVQKDGRVEEDDWIKVTAWGMRHLPDMISSEECRPQYAGSNASLLGQPRAQQTMGFQGLDEVEIAPEDLGLIIIWYLRSSKGRKMKGKLPMIPCLGEGASLPADRTCSFKPSDDRDPEQGLSRAWTLPDSYGISAEPSMFDEYKESNEEDDVPRPGMKGTQYGPTDVTVTPDASEKDTPSTMDASEVPISVGPGLSMEESPVDTNDSQQPAGAMPNALWEAFLGTIWKILELLSLG